MNRLALCLLAFWTVWQASGEEGQWTTDFAKAKTIAKAEKKLILMDFSGSDWCAGCQDLKKNVLDTPTFLGFAKDNLVLVGLDFPEKKKQPEELKKANEALSDQFKVDGFPTVIILNSEGKEIKRLDGYEGQSAKEFVAELRKLRHHA